MPGGDFPTRKGFLDSLLSGCIPVTFQLYSAQKQWLWHWTSVETALDCSIYIPRKTVFANVHKVFDMLLHMSKNISLLTHKRKCIEHIGDRMQYNMPYGFDEYKGVSDDVYSYDAIDVIVDKLFDIII